MPQLFHHVGLPLFADVRSGATEDICTTLADKNLTFRRALVISGSGPTLRHAESVAASLGSGGLAVEIHSINSCRFDEVDVIKREVIEGFFPDVILGVGGGSVIDVTKLAAAERRIPWISIPTSASNDGFCSPVAVLQADDTRKSVGATLPVGVLGDLDILRQAPRRLLLAGVGDLISNLSAVADWELAERHGKASVNHIARMLAETGPQQLLAHHEPNIEDPRFLQSIVEGLLLSGLAMEVSGSSRPCSGAEHLISHALDAGKSGSALHGEQVGIATIFCLSLHEIDHGPVWRLASSLGMPNRPEAVSISREDFLRAVENGPGMRLGRWTILSQTRAMRTLNEHYDACFDLR